MLEVPLAHADLARVRFAHSPLRELVASLRVIADRHRHPAYRGWLSGLRTRLTRQPGPPRLARLVALVAGADPPGFLAPDPGVAWGRLADELEAVAATAPDPVHADLDRRYPRALPAVLRSLYEDPATQLPQLVSELAAYWRAALEPVWPRLRAVCTADVSHRSEQFAAGGLDRLFGGLHPAVTFTGNRLRVDDGHPGRRRADPGGAGVALMPCAFSWPAATVGCSGAGPAWLAYPPRGVGLLWQPPADGGQAAPLRALIGRTRATLLASLELPATTTQLARQLNLSQAAVSQHLKILEASGLATAHRRGKLVLYQRTAAATALLAATDTVAVASQPR